MIPGLITEGLRRILRGEEKPSSSAAEAERKAGAASRRSSIPVGHFTLVGLRDVREHLGPRWPAVAARAHAVARSVITKQLLPGDVFEQQDEESYVILYAQLGPKEAEFKSRAIGREITRRLIGEDFDTAASIRTACASLPIGPDGEVNAEASLAAALAAAPAIVSRAADEPPNTAGREPSSPPPPAPRAAEPSSVPRDAPAELEPKTFTASRIGRTAPSWLYTPIWDLKHRVVIQFRLSLPGARNEAKPSASPLQALCEADIRAVRKATDILVELSNQGKRFSIACPVHASSVAHPVCRREILKALTLMPSALRRLMTIELVAHPAMPPNPELERFVASLKGSGVAVASRMPLNAPAPLLFQTAFSPVLAQLGPTSESETEQIKQLEDFAALGQALNLECGAAGLGSTSLILAATASGFRYLSGRAVQPDVECISHATKFDLDRLYSRQVS